MGATLIPVTVTAVEELVTFALTLHRQIKEKGEPIKSVEELTGNADANFAQIIANAQ